jgi:hypothetical protein
VSLDLWFVGSAGTCLPPFDATDNFLGALFPSKDGNEVIRGLVAAGDWDKDARIAGRYWAWYPDIGEHLELLDCMSGM